MEFHLTASINNVQGRRPWHGVYTMLWAVFFIYSDKAPPPVV